MASNRRRVNSRTDREHIRKSYEDGNAVREIVRDPRERQPRRSTEKVNKKRVSRKPQRARNAGVGYIIALVLVLVITVFSCVNYLQMKSKLATLSTENASIEREWAQLKADNDAYYKKVIASVNLKEVKEEALGKLGLQYATKDQIRYYDITDEGYVRQYTEVP